MTLRACRRRLAAITTPTWTRAPPPCPTPRWNPLTSRQRSLMGRQVQPNFNISASFACGSSPTDATSRTTFGRRTPVRNPTSASSVRSCSARRTRGACT
ncbi:hypothetical protein BIW11_11859 [Tropilaelaps mercedesae]|uniref:Uncharacterized protein n=1 Tax=Tropilaelaps mercedesae TaxID=418985 RepID=A0A1V9X9Q0_9ACAR|nr:hypothetical protein BIW11_11859 [Tropilaelaps mercedesae]